MIVIDKTIVSDEIKSIRFCCDLGNCKGACCIEGDAGAPLEEDEISKLEDDIDKIKPFMRKEGINVIDNIGVFDYDSGGDLVTPLIKDKDCAYVYYNDNIAGCAIEKAYDKGKIDFQKPISCHLYPIRISRIKEIDGINYHKWYICQSACTLGKKLELPLYKFLEAPLIRKYGKDWYNVLSGQIEKE